METPILTLKRGKEKSLLRFHPWIFSGAIENTPKSGPDCLVQVQDAVGNRIGYGFLEPKSQIICRVFEFNNQPLDLDANYWKEKIKVAHAFKQQFIDRHQTNCYRLVHAEGDYFPGLIIDIYADVAVVQFRTTGVWFLKGIITEALLELGFTYIYSKSPAYSEWAQAWIGSEGPAYVEVKENGVKFTVDILKGQKTGFFLDQRDNRQLLAYYSSGKNVLNCFSYTGGFSLYALKGGAEKVLSVDISKEAIEISKQNAVLNGWEKRHEGIAADCFDFLRKAGKDMDLIILDPPAFSKDIRSVPQAARGYKDINLSALKLIKSSGLLFTFSCSQHISKDLFQKIVFSAAADSGRKVRILHQLNQAPDHPVNIYHPEGDYLKGLVLEVI